MGAEELEEAGGKLNGDRRRVERHRAVATCSAEEFAMRSRPNEDQVFGVPLVNQKPVACEVALAAIAKVSGQRMIAEAVRQCLTRGELEHCRLQHADVAIRRAEPFEILLELALANDRQHWPELAS